MDNNTKGSDSTSEYSSLDKTVPAMDGAVDIDKKPVAEHLDKSNTSSSPAQKTASTLPAPSAPVIADQVIPKNISAAAASAPLIADDNDLIEKEWIQKAKDILKFNSKDPHEQNDQMSAYKADYMKKRYNKDIKLTENDK